MHADFKTLDIKDSCKVILSLLIDMIKHSQSTQSNKFPISLQYLKKKVRNGVHFLYADEHQVQSAQNRKLVIFLQYIKKSVATAFVFYCDANYSNILRGSSHVCCHLFFVLLSFLTVMKSLKC